METVRLSDVVLSMDGAKAFDRAFSAIQVNAELFDFEQNLLRFGKKIEYELIYKQEMRKDKVSPVMCLLYVEFDNDKKITEMSVFTEEDDFRDVTEFQSVIDVLIKIGQQMIQGDVTNE